MTNYDKMVKHLEELSMGYSLVDFAGSLTVEVLTPSTLQADIDLAQSVTRNVKDYLRTKEGRTAFKELMRLAYKPECEKLCRDARQEAKSVIESINQYGYEV